MTSPTTSINLHLSLIFTQYNNKLIHFNGLDDCTG